MTSEDLAETIKRELPALLRNNPELRGYILDITRTQYANHEQTEDRFDRIMGELQKDREEQRRKWDKQDRKWDETNEIQNRKWEESRKEFQQVHKKLMAQDKKYDRQIGALGARWGMQSERAFRNALAGILEENFAVEVLNINEYDDEGVVFGRPDQIELDVIIKNGMLLICELKSSMSKSDMNTFERKARFYEKRHKRKAERLIVISPMVDQWAQKLADRLGIEVYCDSLGVDSI